MFKESVLQLKQYNVNEIMFKINKEFDFTIPKEVNIKPQFQKMIQKIDANNFNVALRILIDNYEEKMPFYLNISISGLFNLQDWEKQREIVELNTTAILFPYLRALVTSTTSNGGMNPYILPILNINSLFNKE